MCSNTKLVKTLKIAVFLGLAAALAFLIQAVMTPKWRFPNADAETDKYGDFYKLPEDTVDYLVVGASTTMFSANPMVIYADSGITGYDLGTGRQSLELSYYWTKEALKTQSPAVVFLDTSALFKNETTAEDIMRSLVSMKLSENKLRAIADCKKEWQSYFQVLFPLIQFHVRWNSLTAADWDFSPDPGYFMNGCVLNYNTMLNTVKSHFDYEYDTYFMSGGNVTVQEAEVRLDETEQAWFGRIVELCRENDVKLVPYVATTMLTTEQRREAIRAYLSEFDLTLFDLSDISVTGVDWNRDTYDGGYHTNYWGAAKTSRYMAEYLVSLGLESHRGQEGYAVWDEKLGRYMAWEQDCLYDRRQMAYTYLGELERIRDDSLIILTVMDEASSAWNDRLEGALRRLGVRSSFFDQIQNSFVAVIDGGKSVFEKWDDQRITLNADYPINDSIACQLSLSSAGLVCGNVSEAWVNGVNYSLNGRGLNITVIDKQTARVITSACIDTHDPALTLTEGASSETWRQVCASYQPVEDGVYSVVPVSNSGCALDVSGGSAEENTNIALWENTGEAPQKFEFRHIGGGLCTIRAMCSDKYLAVEAMGSTAGSNVVQQAYTGLANQKWFVTENGDGSYSFTSLYNGLLLDVTGGEISPGTNIQVWNENYETPQQFYLRKE